MPPRVIGAKTMILKEFEVIAINFKGGSRINKDHTFHGCGVGNQLLENSSQSYDGLGYMFEGVSQLWPPHGSEFHRKLVANYSTLLLLHVVGVAIRRPPNIRRLHSISLRS